MIGHVRMEDVPVQSVEVWLVNGEAVRDNHGSAFCLGGHGLVYPWIPAGQVWIENYMSRRETEITLYHELVERSLMLQGASYEEAHRKAAASEDRIRACSDVELRDALAMAGRDNDLLAAYPLLAVRVAAGQDPDQAVEEVASLAALPRNSTVVCTLDHVEPLTHQRVRSGDRFEVVSYIGDLVSLQPTHEVGLLPIDDNPKFYERS